MKKHVRWIAPVVALALVAACGVFGDGDSDPRPVPTIEVSPSSAAPGADVTVRARGFPPGNTIVIGFGPPESEYEVVRQVSTDEDGSVTARLEVPDWAESGRDYVWVAADRDNEPTVRSARFRVTAR